MNDGEPRFRTNSLCRIVAGPASPFHQFNGYLGALICVGLHPTTGYFYKVGTIDGVPEELLVQVCTGSGHVG